MAIRVEKQPSKKRRRKKNPGWFQKGWDKRRSGYVFTRQDCRKGFRTTVCRHPHLLDWVMGRFLSNRDRRRKEREQEPW